MRKNTTLKSIAVLAALSVPAAVAAQQEGEAETGSGQMMQDGGMMHGGEGGMGMMDMSQMGEMMEACTEMMNAMTQKMQNGAPAEGQSEG